MWIAAVRLALIVRIGFEQSVSSRIRLPPRHTFPNAVRAKAREDNLLVDRQTALVDYVVCLSNKTMGKMELKRD
jgi:hypothetical protein